jgi:hypothetical protein
MMTDDERLEAWLSGDLAADEMPAFQAWLHADAANRRRYLSAVALDQDLCAAVRLPPPLALPPQRQRLPLAPILAAAAALLLVLGLFTVAWWPEAPTKLDMATRMVEGWRLTDQLRSERRDTPTGLSVMVIAEDEGWLEADLGRITLSAGAIVRLDRPEIAEPAEVSLEKGTITLQVAARDAPAPVSTTATVGTPCGELVVNAGTDCSLTASSLVQPDGSSTPQVLIAIQSGSVHSAVPSPFPLVWSAGSRVRIWNDTQGRLRHKVLESP